MLQRCSLQLKAGKYSLWSRLVEIFWDFAPFSASVWLSCSHLERVVAAIKICMRGVRSVHWEATSNHFILTQKVKPQRDWVWFVFSAPCQLWPTSAFIWQLYIHHRATSGGTLLFQKKILACSSSLYMGQLYPPVGNVWRQHSFCGESSCTRFDSQELFCQ